MRAIKQFTVDGKTEFSVVTVEGGMARKAAYLKYESKSGELYQFCYIVGETSKKKAVETFNKQLDELGVE